VPSAEEQGLKICRRLVPPTASQEVRPLTHAASAARAPRAGGAGAQLTADMRRIDQSGRCTCGVADSLPQSPSTSPDSTAAVGGPVRRRVSRWVMPRRAVARYVDPRRQLPPSSCRLTRASPVLQAPPEGPRAASVPPLWRGGRRRKSVGRASGRASLLSRPPCGWTRYPVVCTRPGRTTCPADGPAASRPLEALLLPCLHAAAASLVLG